MARITQWVQQHGRGTAEAVYHIVVAGAALAGGIWAGFRAWRLREMQAALSIDVAATTYANGTSFTVPVNVTIKNVGKHQIESAIRQKSGLVYDEQGEQLANCCGLQVKRIDYSAADRVIDWYDEKGLIPMFGEINLASAHETDGQTDLFLEPGESMELLSTVQLEAGDYLLKVTFVGLDERDFYTRTTFLRVLAS